MGGYLSNQMIKLRAFEPRDAQFLHLWENEEESWASNNTLNPLSFRFIEDYICESSHSIITKGEMSLVIERQVDQEPIGYVQLNNYDPIGRKMGLGLYVIPSCRRMGVAHQTLKLVQSYAFSKLGLRMLYADVLASNTACCALFENLKYKHTATLAEWYWLDGAYHDLRYYQLWSNQ